MHQRKEGEKVLSSMIPPTHATLPRVSALFCYELPPLTKRSSLASSNEE